MLQIYEPYDLEEHEDDHGNATRYDLTLNGEFVAGIVHHICHKNCSCGADGGVGTLIVDEVFEDPDVPRWELWLATTEDNCWSELPDGETSEEAADKYLMSHIEEVVESA